jgi:metal-responsive CopG/Arc/MetJ family transcriptional regulator
MATQRRVHLVLPEELLEAVDRIAGKRKRSRFVEEAVREKVTREELAAAMQECVGIIDLADYPEWKTPEGVSEWVRSLREEDNRRFARKLGARQG